MKHKYTRTYFLNEDSAGNRTPFGVAGVEEFKRGAIREPDLNILCRIDFRGKRVLDIGFGRGEAIKYALDHGASAVVGVDFSEDANAIVRESLGKYALQADLHCMDALSFFKSHALQKDSQRFDVVLMLDFVEHVPRSELTETLASMRKWLSDRAVVAINTPVFPVDNDVIAEGLNPRAEDESDHFEETAGMHCNRYTKASLRNHMRACGLVAISGHFFVPATSFAIALPVTRWTRLARWIASLHAYPIVPSALRRQECFEYVT